MTELATIIEAILFASGEPVPIARMSLSLEKDESEIINAADELNESLIKENHSLRVLRLGDKLQICTDTDFAPYISKTLEHRKQPMLSNPALETLAIIAYFQPATLAYISKIRGVDSTYTVSSLSDKGLIEEKGRLDVPGRPILYGTTDAFLRTMSIKNLDELPPLPDLASSSSMDELRAQIDSLSGLNADNAAIEADTDKDNKITQLNSEEESES